MPENKKLRPILVRLGSQALTAVEMQRLAALDGTNARHGIPEEERSAAEAKKQLPARHGKQNRSSSLLWSGRHELMKFQIQMD